MFRCRLHILPYSASTEPRLGTSTSIRVQSSLLLVDVISQDPKSGLPVRDFQKKDFRMFDNRHEVPIATFYAGARYDSRPVTLWLVVICNESGRKILHYMAKQTGGQYFDALPSGYAAALEAILMQLHFRYELGSFPPRWQTSRA